MKKARKFVTREVMIKIVGSLGLASPQIAQSSPISLKAAISHEEVQKHIL